MKQILSLLVLIGMLGSVAAFAGQPDVSPLFGSEVASRISKLQVDTDAFKTTVQTHKQPARFGNICSELAVKADERLKEALKCHRGTVSATITLSSLHSDVFCVSNELMLGADKLRGAARYGCQPEEQRADLLQRLDTLQNDYNRYRRDFFG